MKVGDYIKYIDDNTGTGPYGSWTIEEIDREGLIYFDDGCHCPYDWILEQIEIGDAYVIVNGLVEKKNFKHYFTPLPF